MDANLIKDSCACNFGENGQDARGGRDELGYLPRQEQQAVNSIRGLRQSWELVSTPAYNVESAAERHTLSRIFFDRRMVERN